MKCYLENSNVRICSDVEDGIIETLKSKNSEKN